MQVRVIKYAFKYHRNRRTYFKFRAYNLIINHGANGKSESICESVFDKNYHRTLDRHMW